MSSIPTTDPALLAAQAKAGQAGVDAYNAAKDALTKQRQSAVDQAMREAALRGAPGGSVESIQSQVTSPYDERIASMTQAAGAAGEAAAAQQQRMAAYNAAANASRSLIPGQVELATAPIRAETDFKVAQIGAEGRAKVDEINANIRLLEAKAAAAAAAAARSGGGGGGRRGGGGGGGSSGKLTGTNLKAAVNQGAAQKYQELKESVANYGKAGEQAAQQLQQTAQKQIPQAPSTSTKGFAGIVNALKGQVGKIAEGAAQQIYNKMPDVSVINQNDPNSPTNRIAALNKIILSTSGGTRKFDLATGKVGTPVGAPGSGFSNLIHAPAIIANRVGQGTQRYITDTRQQGYRDINTPDTWRTLQQATIEDLVNQGFKIPDTEIANALGYDKIGDVTTGEQALQFLSGTTPKNEQSDYQDAINTLERTFGEKWGRNLKDVASLAGGLTEDRAANLYEDPKTQAWINAFQQYTDPNNVDSGQSDWDQTVKGADKWLNSKITGPDAAAIKKLLKGLVLGTTQQAPYGD